MDELPLEILDSIAEDEFYYRGMLAIPFFARTITPSRRIDFMIKFGHSIKITNRKIEWSVNGKCHRADGPAREFADGHKEWYVNGKLHRDDGPAIECENGDKEWFINDKLHRLDGPAVEFENGRKEWYIDGKRLTEEEFLRMVKQ